MSAAATGSGTTPLVFAPYGVGDGITTFGIPNRAYIAVGRDNASGSASNITQVSTTLSITTGTATGTVASAAGLAVGMFASHPKFPSGTKITVISGTSITFSNNVTGTLTASGIRFSPILDAQTMGATGGSLTHTLATVEIPSITSTVTSVSVTSSVGGIVQSTAGLTSNVPTTGRSAFAFASNTGFNASTISSSGTGTATSNNTGGLAHQISQPTIVMNYIIKR